MPKLFETANHKKVYGVLDITYVKVKLPLRFFLDIFPLFKL